MTEKDMKENYLVSKLLQENRQLKLQLQTKKINKNRQKILFEKINFIKFLFTTFNCCVKNNTSKLSLFGSFLNNFFTKNVETIDNNLEFYFTMAQYDNSTMNQIMTILNSLDYITFLQHLSYERNLVKWMFSYNKNNVSFRIDFYNYYPNFNLFFDVQNLEYDNIVGLKTMFNNNLDFFKSPSNFDVLDSFASLFVKKTQCYKKNCVDLIKRDPSIFEKIIDTQMQLEEQGYTIEKGVKVMTLNNDCPICFDKFKKGIFFSCRHSFCLECTKTHLKTQDPKCPMCRANIDILFD